MTSAEERRVNCSSLSVAVCCWPHFSRAPDGSQCCRPRPVCGQQAAACPLHAVPVTWLSGLSPRTATALGADLGASRAHVLLVGRHWEGCRYRLAAASVVGTEGPLLPWLLGERPRTRGASAAATAGEHGLQTPPLSVWPAVRVVLGDLHLHVPSVSAASLAGHKQPAAPGLRCTPLVWPSHQSDTAGLSLAAGQCPGLRPCPVGRLLCGALL